jgi:hypothetical protein
MVKYIFIGVAFFLVAVVAFYGGVYVGSAKPDPQPGVPAAPPSDYWTYPGSASGMSSGSGENLLATSTTPDDFKEVARFYHEQIGATLGAGGNFEMEGSGLASTGTGRGTYTYVVDSLRKDGRARGVRVATFDVRSPSYDLSVFVSRAEGEPDTHIVVTYHAKLRP